MTQAPTALTDFALAIEAWAFAWLINRGRSVRRGQSSRNRARGSSSSDPLIDQVDGVRSDRVTGRDARSEHVAHRAGPNETLGRWFVLFFCAAAIASVIGGLVHGYFLDPTTLVARSLWPLTLIAVGATALAAWGIGASIHFPPDCARLFGWIAIVGFLIYSVAVVLGMRSFRYAILNYLPAALFLLSVFTIAHFRHRNSAFPPRDSSSSLQDSDEACHEQHLLAPPKLKQVNLDPMDSSYLLGAIAMVITLAASALQQAKVGILTLGLTHNALYHVLQGVSLLLMFLCARHFDHLESSRS